MRRRAPVVGIVLGIAVLLTWYVAYTQRVVGELRREAKRSARMYAHVYRGLNSPTDVNGTGALLQLADEIRKAGVPLIVTTMDGTPTAAANLPFDAEPTDPRVRAYVPRLDATNDPVVVRGIGMVHFGDTPLVRGLQLYPLLQGITLTLLLAAGVFSLRSRGRADRRLEGLRRALDEVFLQTREEVAVAVHRDRRAAISRSVLDRHLN